MRSALRSVLRGRFVRPKQWMHRQVYSRNSMSPLALLRGRMGLRRALLEEHEIERVASLLARGWGNPQYAAAPELLEEVIREVAGARNAVVECGSGATSVVLAAARKYLGMEVVTLEHDAKWAATVERRLRFLGLHHDAVLVRPLERRGAHTWYSTAGADLPQRVGLVICDGPPASTDGGRAGLVELLRRPWPPDVVLIDDTHREAERRLVGELESLGYVREERPASLGRAFDCLSRSASAAVQRSAAASAAPAAPLNLVFVAPECAPGEGLGRRGHYNEKIARLLAARGHDVTVLHMGSDGDAQCSDGVRFLGIGTPLTDHAPSSLKRRFQRPLRSIEFAWRCRRYIGSFERPPLVHLEINGGVGAVLQVGLRAPTALRLKGHMPTVNRLKHRRGAGQAVTSLLEAISFRTAPVRYAPSDLVGRRYQRASRRRIWRIVTPTDPDFTPAVRGGERDADSGPRFLFFTGTLEELKGVYLLATAFPVVARRLPTATLTVIGRDSRHAGEGVRSRMSALLGDAAPRTRFVDFLGREELAAEICRADVVVLPSLFDNLPNALLEALQLGSLVVGTAGSSIDEVITDGVTGVLCEPTAPALADAMCRAATAPESSQSRYNVSALAARFAPEAVVPTLEALLHSAARDHPVSSRRPRHARRHRSPRAG